MCGVIQKALKIARFGPLRKIQSFPPHPKTQKVPTYLADAISESSLYGRSLHCAA